MEAKSVNTARVTDVMRHGVLSCQAETPLRTIAGMMAEHGVHCIVVTNLDGVSETAWGIVSDVDVLRSGFESIDGRTAADVAGTELLTVGPEEPLENAARLMVEHDVTHLVVVSGHRPIGVLSSLDVAASMAG